MRHPHFRYVFNHDCLPGGLSDQPVDFGMPLFPINHDLRALGIIGRMACGCRKHRYMRCDIHTAMAYGGGEMENFVAVDVETANKEPESICAIGAFGNRALSDG